MRRQRCVVLEEFLVWQELSALTEYALARRDDFRPSQVVAGDHPAYRNHRRSHVLLDPGPVHRVVAERIAQYLDRVVGDLAVPAFRISHVESQITVSNDGDYFRRHDDNTRGCAPTRAISYVYFFHREPRAFTGGELCLHAYPGEPDVPETVAPVQNQLVVFASSRPHEVSPVVCPSRVFADGRFTLNGWIHRERPRS